MMHYSWPYWQDKLSKPQPLCTVLFFFPSNTSAFISNTIIMCFFFIKYIQLNICEAVHLLRSPSSYRFVWDQKTGEGLWRLRKDDQRVVELGR